MPPTPKTRTVNDARSIPLPFSLRSNGNQVNIKMKAQANTNHKLITRGDVRNLLRAYSGAIALDQVRVDALPSGSLHPEYDRGMWLRSRRRHVAFIDQLCDTTRDISKKLLRDISLVAATKEPKVVRKAFILLLSMGANGELDPGPINTAPLFFSVLVEDVGTGWLEYSDDINAQKDVNASLRFADWLNLTDPLSIAEDPECQYLTQLKMHLCKAKEAG